MAKTVRIIASPGLTSQRIRLYAEQDGALVATSEVIAAASGSPLNYAGTIVADAGEYFATIADSADADNVDHWGYVTITAEDPATFDVRGVKAADLPALQSTALSVLEDTGTTLPAQIGTPASVSVAADIAAVKSDTATLLERVTTTVATLWANLAAMISGSLGTAAFTTTALANAPAGGGGGVDNSEQLTRIEDQTSLITSGAIQVVSPVKAGGKITLIKGDDYLKAVDNAVKITVSDAGGVLRGILTDSEQVTSIVVGAGQVTTSVSDESTQVNQIIGSIDPADVTANPSDTNKTDMLIEFTAAATEGTSTPSGAYRYHVKSVSPTGKEVTRVSDTLKLEPKRADP